VAEWVCGGCGDSLPKGENLAVFYQGCSFNCLYCQNWHFKRRAPKTKPMSATELARQVREDTACICFFGGDPTPQLPHALATAREALSTAKGRPLRVCFETNGSGNRKLTREMAQVAMESGGCLKLDLKAWSEPLHMALTGVSNARTLENFRSVAALSGSRKGLPLLVASTVLVPGYIDEHEVSGIARFIAGLNPDIPYALLGYSPQFHLQDLPPTSREHAERCLARAREAGLRNVRLGNEHSLGGPYPLTQARI